METRTLKRFLQYLISVLILFSISSFEIDRKYEKNASDKKNTSTFFKNKNLKDGPYIFDENGVYTVEWIYKNRLVERKINGNNFNVIKRKFGFEIKKDWLSPDSINYIQHYTGVKNFITISDIHGQFDLFVKLLKTYKVIDKDYNWSYGKGHLVINGDVFDRGPRVTESLWLIYKLEKQAKESGGKVHYILGNHELMILNNDLRYMNEKYLTTTKIMGKSYPQLYADNTILGQWLRTKPVMVSINDFLFVHGGISPELIKKNISIEKMNQLFINQITGKDWHNILYDSTLSFLMDNKGPIWYRGYFTNTFKESEVNQILDYYHMKHIVVGHTTLSNIAYLFHGKIIGVDSGIKFGDYGEIFIYKNGKLLRGTLSGGTIDWDY